MLGKNKYSRLLGNTLLFGISSVASKLISFFLTRFYTSYLTPEDFGIVENIKITAQFLIPVVCLGITNAVIRYGLEKGSNKEGIFTGGIVAIGMGFAAMLVLMPLINLIEILNGYVLILYVYVLVSCMRNMFSQFVRAKMQIRFYAIDGLLLTAYNLAFNILFIAVLKMGPVGYLLSIIVADFISGIQLFVVSKLWKYIDFKRFDKPLYRNMLAYSLPLVPATLFWNINSNADSYFLSYMLGFAANGLYQAATRIPNVISLFSTMFTEAWQLSAVTDGQDKDQSNFFTTIFNAMMAVCFIMGGGLILFTRFIMRYLVDQAKYSDAWRYVPFLVIAIVFSTLAVFLNSVYMVKRKSKLSLYTMAVGAVVNLIFNWVFIKWIGINGAGLATLLSYVVVFTLRAVNTRHFIHIKINPLKVILNGLLLFLQALLVIAESNFWQLKCALLLVAVVLVNGYSLYKGLMQLVQKRKRK